MKVDFTDQNQTRMRFVAFRREKAYHPNPIKKAACDFSQAA
ncbi:hypothetical protein HOV93_12630 [Planctomycetes bacterium FF15]|uniref:Uncharacterized protein n=1 Tax=Bremerella alba TaxID=980252 RepID=A0A7V9A6C3_9BACT|nr:hypothetical protein [Bremerella alba]